jgi:hypothetical protein
MTNRIVVTIRQNLIAWLALFVALGGTSLAASKYAITSTKQIKPSVVKSLKGKTGKTGAKGVTGPQGPQGAKGETGAAGAEGKAGASAGLSEANNPRVFLEEISAEQTVANIPNVPAGNYILNAKVTLEDEGGAATLVTCSLHAGSDVDEASAQLNVIPNPGSIETLALTLGHTFASPGAVALTCNDFKKSGIAALDSKISLVQVQTLTRTTGIAPT